MRIVGGKFRGWQFKPGKNFKARPTTDFARENLFNILIHHYDLEDCRVLDIFGGTGSISFEFVSRGCKDVTCVEGNYNHWKFIRSVTEKLGIGDNLHVTKYDVFKFIEKSSKCFDIVFADPPYSLKGLSEIPGLVFKHGMVKPGGILIFEHGKNYNFSEHPNFSGLRTYGSVYFSFFNG